MDRDLFSDRVDLAMGYFIVFSNGLLSYMLRFIQTLRLYQVTNALKELIYSLRTCVDFRTPVLALHPCSATKTPREGSGPQIHHTPDPPRVN